MSRDVSDTARSVGQVGSKGAITVQGVVKLLEEAIQAKLGQVEAGTPLEGLGGLDSMGVVSFIRLVEQRTGVKVRVRDLRNCRTLGAVAQLIQDRLPG
jgi:acyl carrier protein